ncbi:MAG: hypothetical protein JXL84_00465 [Deltaproteobacteria bacterium]|nr:hypothetical protein [Deltaproteobacteria bacterium]
MKDEQAKPREKTFVVREGTLYFTRNGERRVFFVLTVGMLLAGILVKLGIV